MKNLYSALLTCAIFFCIAQNSFSQAVLWTDDFSDGDYTSNWEWVVSTGIAAVELNNSNYELMLTGQTPDWYCNIETAGDTNNLFIPDDYTVTYTTRLTGTAAMGSALAFKIDDVNWYYVLLYNGAIYIVRTIDYVANVTANQVQVDQNLKVKIQSIGDTVKVKVWTGVFEPTVWDLEYDSCYTSGTLYPYIDAAAWWLDGTTAVYFDDFVVYGSSTTDVVETDGLPTKFMLSQNYPNPFNPSTNIEFSLPNEGNVELSIFDMTGQKIATLLNKNMHAGNYKVHWDGSTDLGNIISSGMYLYRLRTDGFVSSKKMILMK
jgi:hypothetical protein